MYYFIKAGRGIRLRSEIAGSGEKQLPPLPAIFCQANTSTERPVSNHEIPLLSDSCPILVCKIKFQPTICKTNFQPLPEFTFTSKRLEKTRVSVLTRAKKCAKISFVFEKDAGVAQSVEQLIRNQQVRCSSHPTSSKKHRKLRLSVLFCYKNAANVVGQGVGQSLTHTLTHSPKCAERMKEHRRESRFLSDAPFVRMVLP